MEQSTHRIGVPPLDTMKAMSGLDFLRGIVEGTLPAPPITETLGFTLAEVAPGFALFTMTPAFKHYNPIGTVHGGVAATLLDSCMSCAIQTNFAVGTGYTTLEIKINYVRPMFETTGEVRCEAAVINMGRTVATADGKLLDANGRLIAHGTTTCMIFDL
jgi:uncharacterized protein (TIGR00369 family)